MWAGGAGGAFLRVTTAEGHKTGETAKKHWAGGLEAQETQSLALPGLCRTRHPSLFAPWSPHFPFVNLGVSPCKNFVGLKFSHSISLGIGTESQSIKDCRVLESFTAERVAELSPHLLIPGRKRGKSPHAHSQNAKGAPSWSVASHPLGWSGAVVFNCCRMHL